MHASYPVDLGFDDRLEPHWRRAVLAAADCLHLTVTHRPDGTFTVAVPDPKACYWFGSMSIMAMVRPKSLVEFSEAMKRAVEPDRSRVQ
jgi:hypothetical protein